MTSSRPRPDLEASAPEGLPPPRTPPTPSVAEEIFGARTRVAEAFVELLADTGISHGLIGPREGPRLWDRHVLNCAVVHPLFDEGAQVADVGSGAGLPGIVLAIVRPDLHLHLVEPLQRRTAWLSRAVAELALDNVTVHHGRAESLWGQRRFTSVTARAVARIGELARWCLPLLEAGGSLHALKGSRAGTELLEDAEAVGRAGGTDMQLHTLGVGTVDPPTTVLSVRVATEVSARRAPAPSGRSGRTRRG